MTGPERTPRGRFFATAAKGTEPLLAEELAELGLTDVREARGGVFFGRVPRDAYRACLWSRIALRVHEPLASFACRDGDELYQGVKAIDWCQYLDGQRTLAVRASGQNAKLTHTHFIAVRAKDAVVDQLRERMGARPSVDRDSPDVLLFVRVTGERASVNLDYSGGSLHARGFRAEEGAAPLRETLAAALVRFSGWRGETPLVDPMCGSGMLLLEAGLWAARRAPGLSHERFGFERWRSFDSTAKAAIGELRAAARSGERTPPPLFGSDADPGALEQCRANAASAHLPVSLRHAPLARVDATTKPGALLANPPYGERLARPEHLTRDLDALLDRFGASQRALIVSRGFPSRLQASRFQAVFNGPIECELRRYDAAGPRLSFRPRPSPA
ncbi:MAG TPA: THUMP domain-containing protein [Polyangiaceae bacterium]|nr:THUMP domain-containing protein [Polyangiaceae bacterium]